MGEAWNPPFGKQELCRDLVKGKMGAQAGRGSLHTLCRVALAFAKVAASVREGVWESGEHGKRWVLISTLLFGPLLLRVLWDVMYFWPCDTPTAFGSWQGKVPVLRGGSGGLCSSLTAFVGRSAEQPV